MDNIEIEYKVMVNKDDYEKLISLFSLKNPINQTNHYFDTINLDLKKNHISLRIREYHDKNIFIATLKEDLSEGKLEREYQINGLNISDLPQEIIDILAKHNISVNNLVNFGYLNTIRYEMNKDDSLLCFDKSTYNGIIDYEIECESDSLSHAEKVIKDTLAPLGIEYKKSSDTKNARFMKSIKNK